MSPEWTVSVEQKIKTCFQKNTPKYKVIESFNVKTVTADQIRAAIKHSDQTLIPHDPDSSDSFYDDEPVLWCVTIFNVYIKTSPVNFDENVKAAFHFFKSFNMTREL
jgi:hypothetical protein